MPSERAIGIFDSGVGGLSVLKEVRRVLSREAVVYLGDTARTPYGSKSAQTVTRYARECARFLSGQDIKVLVVACNTVSSLSLHAVEQESGCPVIGTIEPAVRTALEFTRSGRVGVIGTEATVSSEAYGRRLRELSPGLHVFSKACPLFVPLVEQGMLSGEIVDKVVELYLADLRRVEIDTLILGCTHYPLLAGAISRFLGDGVEIVECSRAMAQNLEALLRERGELTDSVSGDETYFVTDEVTRFGKLAGLFLERSAVTAVHVERLG